VGVVALFTVATVVVGDVAASILAPPRLQREVDDALADWKELDPTILVIGSSHARTFDTLSEELARRTENRERMLAVPVEWGKLSSYLFVLEQRVAPFLASTVDPPRRLILVTEWWDSTAPEGGAAEAKNLPAKAWAFRHWTADVLRNGLNPFNRNYTRERWWRLLRHSALAQDHGYGRIYWNARSLVRPPSQAELDRQFEGQVENWQRYLLEGEETMLEEEQMAALDAILEPGREWGMEVTVLLYPRMPVTITPHSRVNTLQRFSDEIGWRVANRGGRFVDMTVDTPLGDEHFEADFDHVTAEGNLLFSNSALDDELAFLLEPPRYPTSLEATYRTVAAD
jgi:hypothetical protein